MLFNEIEATNDPCQHSSYNIEAAVDTSIPCSPVTVIEPIASAGSMTDCRSSSKAASKVDVMFA
jgi:hypothetical protein